MSAPRTAARPTRPARVYTLERRQTVPSPLETVFSFFAEPRNLARITPPWLAFRLVSAGDLVMAEGLRLEYRVRPLGAPMRWVSRITVWDPPHRFADEQERGPYRYWHHLHEFRAVPGGTELLDRVTYALPLGPLGRLAHALVVRPQLRAIFRFRERVIGATVGASPTPVAGAGGGRMS